MPAIHTDNKLISKENNKPQQQIKRLVTAILISLPYAAGAGTIQFGLEEPKANSTYSGVGNLRGWAVSSVGIEKVELFIDGKYKTDIPSGGARGDVGNKYPKYPDSDKSGYSMAYAYTSLSTGSHQIKIKVTDNEGDIKEKTINFNSTKFSGGYMKDANAIDASSATLSASNDSIQIKGLMANSNAHDVTLKWNPASQGLAFTQIATSSNSGGGNTGKCVNVPFPANDSTIEWDITGQTANGNISGTINTHYIKVSDTGAETDTVSEISGSGVTTTTTTNTKQTYHITNNLLYMDKIVTTGSASVAGFSTSINTTLTTNPPMLMGAVKQFCLNQTWNSPSVSQSITAQGMTTSANSIASSGKVESINESITTPAGTFTAVRVKTTRDDGSIGIVWTAINNGMMLRQEDTADNGDTQTTVATSIN